MKKFLTRIAILAIFLVIPAHLLKAEGEGWTTDYQKALQSAKAEKKLVVLNFTGSDWCEWCIRLQKEVFSQPKFKEYAAKNLVLVEVDFPIGKTLPAQVSKQNEGLLAKFDGDQIFPTIIVLNSDGKKVGELNYVPGGPDAFLAELKKLPKS